jgi:glyceraldehyde 3-phosphate dehydrogenase
LKALRDIPHPTFPNPEARSPMGMRIAINGFGRIGRNVFRIINERKDMEVVSINDITDTTTLAHLLKYDSIHGRFNGKVKAGNGWISVDGRKIQVTAERDPANLPHADNKVDFAVEATGIFAKRADCEKHISAGAKKVLLTVPPKDEIDNMIVLGVNDDKLRASDRIISNASCTTNCLSPMVKVLDEAFGITRGMMTTVHAFTNDQRTHDQPHGDLRRARAASENIIPTSTGAARAVGKIIPKLAGKLDGCSMRVPIKDGSVVDLVVDVKKKTTIEEVNAAFKAAAKKELKGILEYTEDPIVSSDIIGNPYSSVFDAGCTMVMEGTMIKVVSWYDNEWGYSNRVVELMKASNKLKSPKSAAAKKIKKAKVKAK